MMERTAKLFAAFLTACCGTVQAESLDEDSLATLLAAEADAKIARAQLEEAEDAVREAELEVSAAVAVVEAASAELTQSDSGSSRLAYGSFSRGDAARDVAARQAAFESAKVALAVAEADYETAKAALDESRTSVIFADRVLVAQLIMVFKQFVSDPVVQRIVCYSLPDKLTFQIRYVNLEYNLFDRCEPFVDTSRG